VIENLCNWRAKGVRWWGECLATATSTAQWILPCGSKILTTPCSLAERASDCGAFPGYLAWWGGHFTVSKASLLLTGHCTSWSKRAALGHVRCLNGRDQPPFILNPSLPSFWSRRSRLKLPPARSAFTPPFWRYLAANKRGVRSYLMDCLVAIDILSLSSHSY